MLRFAVNWDYLEAWNEEKRTNNAFIIDLYKKTLWYGGDSLRF